MKDVTNQNFGILIAYIIPGFTLLAGLSTVYEPLRVWFPLSPVSLDEIAITSSHTIGGFLYATLMSIGVGMILGAIRWAVIDTIHHRTGVGRPAWDGAELQKNLRAFSFLIEIHYHFYQFYGSSTIAVVILLAARLYAGIWPFGTLDVLLILLAGIFFAASRDALTKYYARTSGFLTPKKRGHQMTNGGSPIHAETKSSTQKPKPPKGKPEGKGSQASVK